MQTRTIKQTGYTFKELLASEVPNKEKHITKFREHLLEISMYDEWADYVIETWTDALQSIGFSDVKIQYSCSNSQGDGASFTCGYIDWDLFIPWLLSNEAEEACESITVGPDGKEIFAGWLRHKIGTTWCLPSTVVRETNDLLGKLEGVSVKVTRQSHHYVHEKTVDTAWEVDRECDTSEDVLLESLNNDIKDVVINASIAIYQDLLSELDYLQSNEYLIEFSEANDVVHWITH